MEEAKGIEYTYAIYRCYLFECVLFAFMFKSRAGFMSIAFLWRLLCNLCGILIHTNTHTHMNVTTSALFFVHSLTFYFELLSIRLSLSHRFSLFSSFRFLHTQKIHLFAFFLISLSFFLCVCVCESRLRFIQRFWNTWSSSPGQLMKTTKFFLHQVCTIVYYSSRNQTYASSLSSTLAMYVCVMYFYQFLFHVFTLKK